MKLLWDNYLTDSTITATSENSLYPVENLYHEFLTKKYMAVGTSTTITVLMPEDRDVSMIAYGFNNVEGSQGVVRITKDASDTLRITKDAVDTTRIRVEAQFTLKSSTGSILYTGTLNTGGDININYFEPVGCRSIELEFASSEVLYIGGLGIGDPLEINYIGITPKLAQQIRSSYSKTIGGQVLGKRSRSLKRWEVTVPIIENTERKAMENMIENTCNYTTFFADLYNDDTTGIEEPIFCNIVSAGDFTRRTHKQQFSTNITLEEAR